MKSPLAGCFRKVGFRRWYDWPESQRGLADSESLAAHRRGRSEVAVISSDQSVGPAKWKPWAQSSASLGEPVKLPMGRTLLFRIRVMLVAPCPFTLRRHRTRPRHAVPAVP